MNVTIQQIAEKAGVSRGTVDRAINRRGHINPEVEERILAISKELGYVAKKRARTAKKKNYRIGVVTFLSKRVFVTEINRGIAQSKRELEQWGIEVLVRGGDSVDEREQIRDIEALMEENISALAIMPVDCEAVRRKLNQISEEKKIPIVTFNADIVGTKRVCFVGMDNHRSGQVAAGLMAMLTRKKGNILVITGFFTNQANNSRVAGFIEELKRSCPGMQITGSHCTFDDADEVEKVVYTALESGQEIAGIFAASSGHAGVERAFRRLGLKPEERPYVIFYDQIPDTEAALRHDMADFIIEQDCFAQGYRAVYVLAYMLAYDQKPEKEYNFTNINIKTRFNL